MPTGYTDRISKGITFQEYALLCARAFGALIDMRDEPMSAPIPKEFEPNPYHVQELAKAKCRLRMVKRMTHKQCSSAAAKQYRNLSQMWNEMLAERRLLREKYEAMLEKVNSFQPPSAEHEAFKEFMASQIVDSIKGDCDEGYAIEEIGKLALKSPCGGGWTK